MVENFETVLCFVVRNGSVVYQLQNIEMGYMADY